METPRIHSKPQLMAAVAVYYASAMNGEPIDLNESEEVFYEMGVNVGVLKAYINKHNREIKASGCPKEIIELLTAKPKRKTHKITRKKLKEEVIRMPLIICQKCGHEWKSRTRYGRPVVRCHRCGAYVDVRDKLQEVFR